MAIVLKLELVRVLLLYLTHSLPPSPYFSGTVL